MADDYARCGSEDGTADALLPTPLLAPLAAIGGPGEQSSGGCDQGLPPSLHASYAQQYLRMAAWLGALFAGYAMQRACCQVGLPQDGLRKVGPRLGRRLDVLLVQSRGSAQRVACPASSALSRGSCCARSTAELLRCICGLAALEGSLAAAQVPCRACPALQIDFLEFFSDASSTALWGAALGWLVGVTCPRRFRWLFSRWGRLQGGRPVSCAGGGWPALWGKMQWGHGHIWLAEPWSGAQGPGLLTHRHSWPLCLAGSGGMPGPPCWAPLPCTRPSGGRGGAKNGVGVGGGGAHGSGQCPACPA